MAAVGMESETALLSALGLTGSRWNGWKKKGEVNVYCPLAIKGLLAERGFTVGLKYIITKGDTVAAGGQLHSLLAENPLITRKQQEVTVRALVASLASGNGICTGDLEIVADVITSLLDNLLRVQPTPAPVGASDEIYIPSTRKMIEDLES